MTMGIEIEIKNDTTIFTTIGELYFTEFISVYKKFYEGKPTKHIIFDVSQSDLDNISLEQIIATSEYLKHNVHKRPTGAKTALVVSKMVDFSMMKMFQIWSEIKEAKLESKIFYELEDAFNWIADD